jgi:hypothetical protein
MIDIKNKLIEIGYEPELNASHCVQKIIKVIHQPGEWPKMEEEFLINYNPHLPTISIQIPPYVHNLDRFEHCFSPEAAKALGEELIKITNLIKRENAI